MEESETTLLESKTTSDALFIKVPMNDQKIHPSNSVLQMHQANSNFRPVSPAIKALRNMTPNTVSLSAISISQRLGSDFEDLDEEGEYIPNTEESNPLVLQLSTTSKLNLESFTSSDSSGIVLEEESVAKRRKRVKRYFEEKGSILIFKQSKLSTNLTQSPYNGEKNSCYNGKYDIRNVIIIQSVIRKWLVNHYYKQENINRLKRRENYKNELKCKYDLKINEITSKINSGKSCEEFTDAKQLFKDYNEIIFGKNSNGEETRNSLHYLFNICNRNQLNIDDGINKSEFCVLTGEILNIPISDTDLNALYENDEILLNFDCFCNWLFNYLNAPKIDFYTTVYL